jgi:hypothetical protein
VTRGDLTSTAHVRPSRPAPNANVTGSPTSRAAKFSHFEAWAKCCAPYLSAMKQNPRSTNIVRRSRFPFQILNSSELLVGRDVQNQTPIAHAKTMSSCAPLRSLAPKVGRPAAEMCA